MRIRSKKVLPWRTRENRFNIVELAISKYSYDAEQKIYTIYIKDYWINEHGVPVFIEENIRYKNSEDVKQLAETLQKSFSPGDDLSEFLEYILQYALLIITTTDEEPVYLSEPEDWELVQKETYEESTENLQE